MKQYNFSIHLLVVVSIGLGVFLYPMYDNSNEQEKIEINQPPLFKYNAWEFLRDIEKLHSACMGVFELNYDLFSPRYNRIVVIDFKTQYQALKKATEILKENGFNVTVNSVFNTVTTHPEDIGYQIWKVTKEKWKVSYQFGIQIHTFNVQNYWELVHKIVGSRSGKIDRLFRPSDFKTIEKIFIKLYSILMNTFCSIK